MNTRTDKTQEKKSQSVAGGVSQRQSSREHIAQFVDNRPAAAVQSKLQEMADNSPRIRKAAQLRTMIDDRSAQKQPQPIQKKENNTGLPDNLKTGMEHLSGYSLDDVKVHYNSDKPAQLQAHAFAQGTHIHVAAGQEKHLPHEAWHVVQQKQGRVKPTLQLMGRVNVNDDDGLEKEADVMGNKAATSGPLQQAQLLDKEPPVQKVVQRGGEYQKLKKDAGPEMDHHKEMGKQIVAIYRNLGQLDTQLKKGKGKEAIKSTSLGLIKIGITIATIAFAAPGVGEAIGSGGVGLDTLGSEALSKGGGFASSAAASSSPGSAEHLREATTTSGAIKGKIKAKVGTPEAVIETLLGFIPFYKGGKMVVEGAQMAAQSRDEWNKEKGIIIRHVQQSMSLVEKIIADLDDDYAQTEIVSANKKILARHKRRSLAEVVANYHSKAAKLQETIEAFEGKHPEHLPLLGEPTDDHSEDLDQLF